MSDNVTLPGAGSVVATDEIGGAQVQYMKLMDGTNGSAVTISGDATYGLDVDVTHVPYNMTVVDTALESVLGTTAGSGITTDINGTIQQYLRGMVKLLDDASITTDATPITISGGVTVSNTVLAVAAGDNTAKMYSGTTELTPKFSAINVVTAGDNALVNAVAAKKIRVLNYVIVASGTVAVAFRSGTTPLTGYMPLVANMGVSAPYSPIGQFETAVSGILNLNLNAAIGVEGHLAYIEV